ncbi:MAG: tRNA pseudouridine(55) synthase TruB [Phycisphaerae bacterium]|nr:tRNA pseudouridine(55) synthase TruB [Phycisphaerae bacterium]
MALPRPRQPDAIVIVDKPVGWSSAKAVTAVRSYLGGRRCKIGHAGTLDPKASGLLVLLVGRATRLSSLLMDAGKEYVATIRLGVTSPTDDAEGPLNATEGVSPPPADRVAQVCSQFVGEIAQRPPAHSAVKIAGQRAYWLARRGRGFETASRTIVVRAIELLEYNWPDVRVRIDCGRGTYVRSIARDIGAAMAVGGYLAELRRTRVGPFTVAQAIKPGNCRRNNIPDWLLPLERAADLVAPEHWVVLDATQAALIARGKTLDARKMPQVAAFLASRAGPAAACSDHPGYPGLLSLDGAPPEARSADPLIEPMAAFDPAGRLIAICRLIGIRFQPTNVLRPLTGPMPPA